jgi:hypothetical protein
MTLAPRLGDDEIARRFVFATHAETELAHLCATLEGLCDCYGRILR